MLRAVRRVRPSDGRWCSAWGPDREGCAPVRAPPAGNDPLGDLLVAAFSGIAWVVAVVSRLVWRLRLVVALVAGFEVANRYGYGPAAADFAGGAVLVLLLSALVLRVRFSWRFDEWIRLPWWRRRKVGWLRRAWPQLRERLGLVLVDTDRVDGSRTVWTPSLSALTWLDRDCLVLTGTVRMVGGQHSSDLADVADRLGAATGAMDCRVAAAGPLTATVTWSFDDPLTQFVGPLPVAALPDLVAVPVGLREDGALWTVRLLGTHVLVVGVTGAGKGSVVWSLLRGVAGGIASGLVEVWAVDGKAGMELSPGRALFTRFATTVEDGVDLLEQAAVVMTERATRLAGKARAHTPTVAEPLIVIVVDEVALLTAYQPDRKLRDRAEKALAVIATQGRAPGVVLVAALQDPRKEVLGLRNLFPTKVGMRLDEKVQVDMVLGEGARDAGAACHQIPESMPGVAFVKVDGVREPVRVRASYLDDDAIVALAADYPAPVRTSVPAPAAVSE